MKENPIWNIIARKFSGEITEKEDFELKEWENRDKINSGILKRLVEIWDYNPVKTTKSRKIYKTFRNRINYHEKRKKLNPIYYYSARIAAILFIIISTAILVNNFIPFNKNKEITYQEIAVPKGSRTSIILPDGSKVWISNNSKIKYPDKFGYDKRELYLSGEAYFEVTKNIKKPFIVNIGSDRIKVLGTKFSVSAYPEDSIIRADLLTGKIQLDINTAKKDNNYKSYTLKPSHALVYKKTSGDITSSAIPEGFFDYWEKGIYKFTDENLEKLAQKIDRIYNVKIVFENDFLKKKRFSGSISINDNIFTFMEAVKRTSLVPIDYKYEDKKIFINLK
jgi:transmembrane sensor